MGQPPTPRVSRWLRMVERWRPAPPSARECAKQFSVVRGGAGHRAVRGCHCARMNPGASTVSQASRRPWPEPLRTPARAGRGGVGRRPEGCVGAAWCSQRLMWSLRRPGHGIAIAPHGDAWPWQRTSYSRGHGEAARPWKRTTPLRATVASRALLAPRTGLPMPTRPASGLAPQYSFYSSSIDGFPSSMPRLPFAASRPRASAHSALRLSKPRRNNQSSALRRRSGDARSAAV
jgi:hypothetical protein